MATWHKFLGMVPGLSPVHLPPDTAEYCENVFIGKGDALYPEYEALKLHVTLYNPDCTPFAGKPVTLWRSGESWFAWDHFVTVIRDPRHYEDENAFLFVDAGKIWRMSENWLNVKKAALPIGLNRPTDTPVATVIGTRDWQIPFSPVSDVPDGDVPPEDTIEDGSQPGEARSYVYTRVNTQDEESAPSFPSKAILVPPRGMVSVVAEDTKEPNIKGWRWYRTVPSEDGLVTYKFVAETEMPDLQDVYDPMSLGDILETEDHYSLNDQIPSVAPEGICRIGQAGVMVWSGNEMFVSASRLPHAFAPRDRFQIPFKIVTCVSCPQLSETSSSFVAYALTDRKPYTVNYVERANVFQHAIDEPCLSPMLATTAEGACVYVSTRGLIQLDGSNAESITDEVMTLPSWEDFVLEDAQLTFNQERFILFSPYKSWVFIKSRYAKDRVLSFSASTNTATAQLSLAQEGIFFYDDGLYLWGAGSNPLTARWRSRQEQQPEYFNPGAVKVDMGLDRTGTAVVKFWRNAQLWATKTCKSQQPHHLPRQGKGIYWQMEITTQEVVYRIMAEKSVGDMAFPTANRTEG